jgi:hypothetical protein
MCCVEDKLNQNNTGIMDSATISLSMFLLPWKSRNSDKEKNPKKQQAEATFPP